MYEPALCRRGHQRRWGIFLAVLTVPRIFENYAVEIINGATAMEIVKGSIVKEILGERVES